ncbi:MAG: DUF481 domain-containing protein [Proteobacteria bacterium]|nr:DUF481 domain-containing protein [Pseudomonadota bacterium]
MRLAASRPAALCLACVLAAAAAAAEDDPDATPTEAAPSWSGKLRLGGSLATGDTDAFAGSLFAEAERAWSANVVTLATDNIWGEADGDTNAKANKATARYRRDFSAKRWFLYAELEGGRDVIQDINWRVLVNLGPGWRLWTLDDKQYLDLELGAGYRHESYRGETADRDDTNLRLATVFKRRLGESVELTHDFKFLLPVNDPKGFLGRTGIELAAPLVEGWFFDAAFRLEYLNEPAEDNQSLNTKTTFGLEYRF